MRNKSIQNTNIQTNTKMQRKDDRQTVFTIVCYSELKHKDTPKDYALELEFLGNAVLYKIPSTTCSF